MEKLQDYKSLGLRLYRKLRDNKFANTSTIKKEFPRFDGRKKEHWILLVAKLLDRNSTFVKNSDAVKMNMENLASSLYEYEIVSYGNPEIFGNSIVFKFTHRNSTLFNVSVHGDIKRGVYILYIGRSSRGTQFKNINELAEYLIRYSANKTKSVAA
jgi:hypothetical protein